MSKIKFEIKNNVPFLSPDLTTKLKNKVLVISGTGVLNKIESKSIAFSNRVTKKSDIKHVLIKTGITKIGDGVFGNNFKNLDTIFISETVKKIGYEQFTNPNIKK